MAGYSGTPLPRKLGIGEGAAVALLEAPTGFEGELEPLPDRAHVARRLRADLDLAVLFTTSRAHLARRFATVAGSLKPAGSLWVAWPKRASKVPTDLTENVVRGVGLEAGMVDTKVCAIDEVWSGLRFVLRLKDRPSRHPSTNR